MGRIEYLQFEATGSLYIHSLPQSDLLCPGIHADTWDKILFDKFND